MASLRDRILGLQPTTRIVATRAGDVLVRGYSLEVKDRIQIAAIEGKPWRGIAVAYCALDPDTGETMFGPEDVPALNALPVDLESVIDAANELSAMTKAELEELEGN